MTSMDATTLIENYPWYLPAHIALWRECGGSGAEPVTELVVLNHPEAVVDREVVDMALLMSMVDNEATNEEEIEAKEARPVVLDAIASLRMMKPKEVKSSASRDLIDKFLEVKDLRITLPSEEDDQEADVVWEESKGDQKYTVEDELASEELARIYLKQKLYSEANDIYNRLFLLYSEKSVYFATQIENIAKMLENSDNDQ